MERKEAKEKTINILLGDDNKNADFYRNIFEKYEYVDTEMTPISPIKMPNLSYKIHITEDVYKKLLKIIDLTAETNKEVAYFLLGSEKTDKIVEFDTIVSTYKTSEYTAADFDDINEYINDYVNDLKIMKNEGKNIGKPVICHGHTHGRSPVSDNFSFGDLISYVELKDAHSLFRDKTIDTIGLLIPPCGDFNFIMYENDPIYEGFYKFPYVYVKDDNNLTQLPAYENGNYLTELNNKTI